MFLSMTITFLVLTIFTGVLGFLVLPEDTAWVARSFFFRFSGYFGGLVRDDWRTTRPQERTARRDEDARIAVYLTERGLMAKPGS